MIDVYDGVMGCGKSTAIIKEVRQGIEDLNRYLVIVPSLDEIDRYLGKEINVKTDTVTYRKDCCHGLLFQPIASPTKSAHLRDMIKQGTSIITTHKLFEMWDDEIADIVELQDYRIIIDEETNCFIPFWIKRDVEEDLRTLGYIYDSDDYGIEWNDNARGDTYNGAEEHVLARKICLRYSVHKFGNDMIVQFPVKFFSKRNTYSVYTYRFESSYLRAYFDFSNIKYQTYQLLTTVQIESKMKMFRNLITIVTPKTKFFDDIGNGSNYSHTWWSNQDLSTLKKLRSNTGMYMKRNGFTKGKTVYCCPKGMSGEDGNKTHAAPTGYKGDFLAYNSKATNNYAYVENMAYLMNVYPNVNIFRYANARLNSTGCKNLNKDSMALSTLLQCIWRTAIRNDKPIKVLLLSNRMEKLLVNWLNETSII